MQKNMSCLGIGLWMGLGLGSSGRVWGVGHRAVGVWGMEACMSVGGLGLFMYYEDI